jgi:hypothetical protein
MLPQDNNWGKHVLETRAPHQTQPQKSATMDGWRTATLSVPENSTSNKPQIIIKEALPVAPPRKKRRAASFAALPTKSQLTDRKSSMVPNGFRDVFGREERRYSTESILNERATKCKSLDSRLPNIENTTKMRRHSSYSSSLDEFADFSKDSPANQNDTLTRVVPKIGNKKTDKFFGESLAACLTDEERRKSSIAETDFFHIQKRKENQETVPKENVVLNKSPVRPPPPNPPKRRNSSLKDGDLTVKIEKSTVSETASAEPKLEEKSTASLDRKAQFLMDMLDPSSPLEDEYKGRIPVEEPLLVAKKKDTKCICCNDDEQLRHHLHLHEKKVEEIDLSNPPRKPSRDFSKISTKSIEIDTKKPEESIPELPQRTHRVKRSVTHNDTEENLKKISEQSLKLHRNISMPTVESLLQSEEELENLMKRCNSSNSFEAHDIIDELIQKAYPGFDGVSSVLHDQHHDSYNDGSHLVAPSFKLDSKRNSFTRLNSLSSVTSGVSITVEPDQDGVDKKTKFTIGPKEIELSDFNRNIDDFIQIETKSADISKPIITIQTTETIEKPEIKEAKEILTESNRSKVKKDEILHDENPQESHLDDSAINQIIESSDLNVNHLTSVLDDIYANNKTIVEDFHNYLEVEANKDLVAIHKVPSRSKLSESETEKPSESIQSYPKSDYEDNEEQDIEEDLPHIKPIELLKHDRPRRESIDDVDLWFTRHSTAPINKNLDEIVHGPHKERRNSEGTYDTSKIYPFGQISRERTISQSSSDFFENRHRSIPHLNLVDTDESALMQKEESKQPRIETSIDSKDDHSTLLAILKKESPKKEEM